MCVIKNTRIACLQKEISRNYVSFVALSRKVFYKNERLND